MGDGDDSEVSELLVDKFLNLFLSNQVDVGGGFIHDDDLVLAEDSSDDADELSFARGKVVASFFDFEVDWISFIFSVITLFVFKAATFE